MSSLSWVAFFQWFFFYRDCPYQNEMNGRYCPFKKDLFLEKHDKFQHVFLYRKIKLLWECSSITSAGFPLFWTAPLCVTIVIACLTPYQNSKIQAIILAPAGGFLYNYHHHKENVPPIYKKCLSPRDKQFVCPPPHLCVKILPPWDKQ